MKPLLLLLLLHFFATIGANAQFMDEGSVWFYQIEPVNFGDSYGELKILLKEYNYQKDKTEILFESQEILFIPDLYSTRGQDTNFTKYTFRFNVIDSVIYYAQNLVWFDYKLRLNDTISFYRYINNAPDSFIEFYTDSIYFDNNNLKNWRLKFAGDSLSINYGRDYGDIQNWQITFNEKMGFTNIKMQSNSIGYGQHFSSEFIPFYYWSFKIDHFSRQIFQCYQNPIMDLKHPFDCKPEYLELTPIANEFRMITKYQDNILQVNIPQNFAGSLELIGLDGQLLTRQIVPYNSLEYNFEITQSPLILKFTDGQVNFTKKLIPFYH